jgi:hypothetical protein
MIVLHLLELVFLDLAARFGIECRKIEENFEIDLRLRLCRVVAKYHRIAGNVVEALLTIDVSIGRRCISKSISSVFK